MPEKDPKTPQYESPKVRKRPEITFSRELTEAEKRALLTQEAARKKIARGEQEQAARIREIIAKLEDNQPVSLDKYKDEEIAQAEEILEREKTARKFLEPVKRVLSSVKGLKEKMEAKTNSPFSYWGILNGYKFPGAIVPVLLEIHKRKKSLAKIKEQGWESFEDIEILDIEIEKIIKGEFQGSYASMGPETRGYSYYDIHGRKIPTQVDFERVYGKVKVKGPLFGDQPFDMEWRADFSQTEQDVNRKEYGVGLYWHQNIDHIYSAHNVDIEIPPIIDQQGKKYGLMSPVYHHFPQYAIYHIRQETFPGHYKQVSRDVPSRLVKVFYANLTAKVFAELKKYAKENCFPDQVINPDYQQLSFEVSTEISRELDQKREQEIILGLQTRQFDEKVFYYGPGAEKFLDIIKSPEYQLANLELQLIKDKVNELAPFLKNRVITDLGAANAMKALPLLEKQLESKPEPEKVDYVPIDINPSLILAAAANLNNPRIKVEGKVIDFSKPLKGKLLEGPKTLTLLGSTLGNGDSSWQKALLKNIEQEMTQDDYLLVGVSLKTDLNQTRQMYDNEKGREFVFATIKNLGFPLDKIDLEISIDGKNSQIVHVIKIKQDLVIKRSGHEIDYKKGEEVKILVSQKYEIGELEQLAQGANLEIAKSFTDKDKNFQLAVLQKK